MEIFRFKSRDLKDYSIISEYWETSRAWGHRSILMYNNVRILETKVRYYNRTWECYRYETCMRKLINEYREDKLNEYIENYKYDSNIDRFRKGEKETVIKSFDSSEIGKRIDKMLKAIRDRDFKR